MLIRKKFFFSRKKKIKIKGQLRYFRCAIVVIKRVHSNIFLTLCDLKGKVIICYSPGMLRSFKKKKKKIAPQALEGMVIKMWKYFRRYRITFVKLHLKIKRGAHVYSLVRELRMLGLRVFSIVDVKRVPHNGMRGRKVRRI